MYIDNSELFTHLYQETVEAISGSDERQLLSAVKGAVAEAKGYLHKYDVREIFGATGEDRDPLLLILIKDMAVWHYINIANPNVDFSVREKRYNDAIAWLKGVQKGDIVPELPVPEDADGNPENISGILFGSNPKRNNYI
jgi:phage gp36-like protein